MDISKIPTVRVTCKDEGRPFLGEGALLIKVKVGPFCSNKKVCGGGFGGKEEEERGKGRLPPESALSSFIFWFIGRTEGQERNEEKQG